MATTIQQFSIFLASPGDVQTERAAVRSAVESVNRTLGNNKGFVLKVVGWDTDARPGFGDDSQGLLNTSIGKMDEYDLFVGILWKRFGTKTPRAASGTKEEFDRAAASYKQHKRPEIMLYAGQMPFNPTRDDLEQKGKILDFLTEVRPMALYWEYDNPADFERLFRQHLEGWILERLNEQPPDPPRLPPPISLDPAPTTASSEQPRSENPTQSATRGATPVDQNDWTLVGEGFYLTQSVVEKNDDTIVLELLPQDAEEDAALRALQHGNQHIYQQSPVPFAHGNNGGIARVESAESKTISGNKVWTVILKVQKESASPFGDPTINGVTPDQAAELRAKLLLLNQPIPTGNPQVAGHDMTARMIMAPMKEKQGIFPGLWQRFQQTPSLFLPLARLWAIYILRASNTCEHVLELQLKLVEGESAVDVKFRGVRHRVFSNRPPGNVGVSGRCPLA